MNFQKLEKKLDDIESLGVVVDRFFEEDNDDENYSLDELELQELEKEIEDEEW